MAHLRIAAETMEQAESLCAALRPLWPEASFHSDFPGSADHILLLGNAKIDTEKNDNSAVWQLQKTGDETQSNADYLIQSPIRLAALVQKIKEQTARHRILELGDYRLDQGQRRWMAGTNEPIDLTEKEVALLSYLAVQHPTPATREDLLREVWKYADGADTHTIETHLYRLRQKIEQNPGDPTIVVSTKQGYILGIL
jgi:hypothetical protein